MDHLVGVFMLSKIDMHLGYHQIRVFIPQIFICFVCIILEIFISNDLDSLIGGVIRRSNIWSHVQILLYLFFTFVCIVLFLFKKFKKLHFFIIIINFFHFYPK